MLEANSNGSTVIACIDAPFGTISSAKKSGPAPEFSEGPAGIAYIGLYVMATVLVAPLGTLIAYTCPIEPSSTNAKLTICVT